MNKNLIIIRGLPGSGKSTFALAVSQIHWEADMFFVGKDGKYNYDPALIPRAHEWCRKMVEDTMIEDNHSVIAVSNTFVRKWEYHPYVELAKQYGYKVSIVTMSGELFRNEHGVPGEKINQMKANWEY